MSKLAAFKHTGQILFSLSAVFREKNAQNHVFACPRSHSFELLVQATRHLAIAVSYHSYSAYRVYHFTPSGNSIRIRGCLGLQKLFACNFDFVRFMQYPAEFKGIFFPDRQGVKAIVANFENNEESFTC